MTEEQARQLKVGDRVRSVRYILSSKYVIDWVVWQPPADRLFPEDKSLIQYIESVPHDIASYIFIENLEDFTKLEDK